MFCSFVEYTHTSCARGLNESQDSVLDLICCTGRRRWLHSGVLLGGARSVQMGQLAPKAPGSPPVSPSSYTRRPFFIHSKYSYRYKYSSGPGVASHSTLIHSALDLIPRPDFQMWSLWGNISVQRWFEQLHLWNNSWAILWKLTFVREKNDKTLKWYPTFLWNVKLWGNISLNG